MGGMRRLCALGLALLVACTSDASDLLGGGADAGARADSGQAQPDAGASLSCAEASAQISQDDRPELLALGFRLATTVLEGELGVGAVDGNFLRASFRVTRVRRGHAGLLGATVEVLTDHAMASADPEEVVLGFDDGGFGQYTDDMRHILGATLVAAREEEWAGVEPFLDYNGFEVGAAYVVEVRAVTDEALSLFVHDTLAGPQARVVELQWSSFGRPRPSTEVSEDRYILSLPELEVDREGFGSTYFPFVLDWRAATAEARAEVERVLAAPPPPVDADALRAFAEAYALGFVFFLAPHPVTTEVTGIAFECCTGAGGTYVRHEVRRGADEGEVFQRGGHAYYSDEACGDRRLLAAGELVPPTSTQPFDCDQGGAAGDYEPVTAVLAELDDTPTNAARVRAWVEADRPLYRVGPQDRAPATPSPSGGCTATCATAAERSGRIHPRSLQRGPKSAPWRRDCGPWSAHLPTERSKRTPADS